MKTVALLHQKKLPLKTRFSKRFREEWQLYVCLVLPLTYLIVFCFLPMYGIQIAFKDYRGSVGIWGSKWVGFHYFEKFFSNSMCSVAITNTLLISVYSIVAGFPIPILLALLFNASRRKHFSKTVQMIMYAPYFISVTVMVGMIFKMLSLKTGLFNNIIEILGGERINYLATGKYFSSIYVWSGIWQGAGFGTLLYLSALASSDPNLHDAAIIDGATRAKRILYIDLPVIRPIITINLILNLGGVLNVGFEKILLMQNSLNLNYSEVIQSLVYKTGMGGGGASGGVVNYSYGTAIGLFNSVVNLVLVLFFNFIAGKLGEQRIW